MLFFETVLQIFCNLIWVFVFIKKNPTVFSFMLMKIMTYERTDAGFYKKKVQVETDLKFVFLICRLWFESLSRPVFSLILSAVL